MPAPDRPHRFKLQGPGDRRLICPKCLELLHRDDIGHFPACPYCDTPLALDRDLEDFLLQPVVNHWLSHQLDGPGAAFLSAPPPAE